MARPKAKPKTENARPGQKARESQPPDPAHPTISKAEAVRHALAAGKESTDDGVGFIKSRYGIEITKQMFSSYKTQDKARNAKHAGDAPKSKPGRKPKAASPAVGSHAAPPTKRRGNDERDLLAAMEAMKPLVASLGVEKVKRLVELMG